MARYPEVREADADAATAALYADIRASSALPQVNLIYRHLATIPGALPAVWGAIRPWMRSAEADSAVARLTSPIPGAPIPSVPDAAAVRDLLAVYARGNAMNLVALSAVRLRLLDPGLPPGTEPPPRSGVMPVPPIPALPRFDALDAATLARVDALAALHAGTQAGVVPSLYLHLAHWPGLLPGVQACVVPFAECGGLREARAETLAAVDAMGTAGAPGRVEELEGEARDRAVAAISLFTTQVIPDLVGVGRLLAGSVPG